tara:strand:+ start:38 stop:634 length:597 start_codon:yes stop_codon:yes gene_type:complete
MKLKLKKARQKFDDMLEMRRDTKNEKKQEKRLAKLKKKSERVKKKQTKADARYGAQLDREKKKDKKSGVKEGYHTKARRKKAQRTQRKIGTAIETAGSLYSIGKGISSTLTRNFAKKAKNMPKAFGGGAAGLVGGLLRTGGKEATIFEPKLARKVKLRRKQERVQKKIAKQKKNVAEAKRDTKRTSKKIKDRKERYGY